MAPLSTSPRARSPIAEGGGIATPRGREDMSPAPLVLAGVLRCREHTSVTSNARTRTRRDRPVLQGSTDHDADHGHQHRRSSPLPAGLTGERPLPGQGGGGCSRSTRTSKTSAPAHLLAGGASTEHRGAAPQSGLAVLTSIYEQGLVYIRQARAGPRGEAFAGDVWVSRRRLSFESRAGVPGADGGGVSGSRVAGRRASPVISGAEVESLGRDIRSKRKEPAVAGKKRPKSFAQTGRRHQRRRNGRKRPRAASRPRPMRTCVAGQVVHPGVHWGICRDSDGTRFALVGPVPAAHRKQQRGRASPPTGQS